MDQKISNIRNIGLIYNSQIPAGYPLAEKILAWLEERGIEGWCCPREDHHDEDKPADLLITLGGDGSILRAMRQAAPAGVPVLGLNLGRVGFLTEAQPDAWEAAMERVLMGEGHVEDRMMLRVLLIRDDETIAREDALNDAVISRGALARTVRLRTYIDGAPLTRYVADGLIVSTATGSTAYAYAVGGPIMPPWLDNILVAPAAAHLSLDRPLVLNAGAIVEVEVHTDLPGMLTVDGRLEGELEDSDRVRITRSPLRARFLRLRTRHDFYSTLVERLTPCNGD